jgi:hypothetical protein
MGGLGDLEHRAGAVPPNFCCAEQVAVGVSDQAAERIGTICVVEVDQGRKLRLSDVSCPDLVED